MSPKARRDDPKIELPEKRQPSDCPKCGKRVVEVRFAGETLTLDLASAGRDRVGHFAYRHDRGKRCAGDSPFG